MGEKDKAQKILESYNDVFADIVNVLLFGGEQVISEEDLVDQTPLGYYKITGEIHEQARDIAKRWMNGCIRIASYGIENQMKIDRNMPVRALAYDVGDLQEQILAHPYGKLYPIVTMVLYYGDKTRWTGPKCLTDRLTTPPALKPFVFDYRMHLFEIAFLTREQVKMFRSDFRIVADYFVQKRENGDYKPDRQTMRHVQEILQLLCIMEDDTRFIDVYNESIAADRAQKGEIHNMCDVLDRVYEEGARAERAKMRNTIDEALERGARAERAKMQNTIDEAVERRVHEERVKTVKALGANHFAANQIAEMLGIPLDTVTAYLQ